MAFTATDKNTECQDMLDQKAFNRCTKLDLTNVQTEINANKQDYTQIFLLMGA